MNHPHTNSSRDVKTYLPVGQDGQTANVKTVYTPPQNIHNNPKYWDRQAFANSVDPYQMLQKAVIRVYTVCHTHSNRVEWTISNFRTSTHKSR